MPCRSWRVHRWLRASAARCGSSECQGQLLPSVPILAQSWSLQMAVAELRPGVCRACVQLMCSTDHPRGQFQAGTRSQPTWQPFRSAGSPVEMLIRQLLGTRSISCLQIDGWMGRMRALLVLIGMGAGTLLRNAVSPLPWLQLLPVLSEGPFSIALQGTKGTRALHTVRQLPLPGPQRSGLE